mmetsp:Transcript_59849/g.118647  ORF Transcript_59849/g.118647 Transcript_59849/m.118647 type:complete len:227 (+) Transcript_59849:125-805(+)
MCHIPSVSIGQTSCLCNQINGAGTGQGSMRLVFGCQCLHGCRLRALASRMRMLHQLFVHLHALHLRPVVCTMKAQSKIMASTTRLIRGQRQCMLFCRLPGIQQCLQGRTTSVRSQVSGLMAAFTPRNLGLMRGCAPVTSMRILTKPSHMNSTVPCSRLCLYQTIAQVQGARMTFKQRAMDHWEEEIAVRNSQGRKHRGDFSVPAPALSMTSTVSINGLSNRLRSCF